MLALVAHTAAAWVVAPVRPPAHARHLAVAMQHDGKGFGGGEATRDPAPTLVDPNDPKGKQQAIHKAESFADYLARRGGATATAEPAADATRESNGPRTLAPRPSRA